MEKTQLYEHSERIEYGSGKSLLTREDALKYTEEKKSEMLNKIGEYVDGTPNILEKKNVLYVMVPVKEAYFL